MEKRGVAILQLVLMITVLVCGWLGYSYIDQVSGEFDRDFLWTIGVILVTLVAVVVGIYLDFILHEVGHLICGILTGYRFAVFYVFSLTIMREEGKLRKEIQGPGDGRWLYAVTAGHEERNISFQTLCERRLFDELPHMRRMSDPFFILADTADLLARAPLVIGILGVFKGVMDFIPSNIAVPNDGYILFNMGKGRTRQCAAAIGHAFGRGPSARYSYGAVRLGGSERYQ